MTQDTSHRAQTQLPATYLIPRGAGQRGWGPLHFRDFSIIHNIKVTPPNHHLPRPTSTQIQGRKLLASPSRRTWAQRRPPKFWANGRTPQLNSGTCPPLQRTWMGHQNGFTACHHQACALAGRSAGLPQARDPRSWRHRLQCPLQRHLLTHALPKLRLSLTTGLYFFLSQHQSR